MIDSDDLLDLEYSDLEPLTYDHGPRYDVAPVSQGKRPSGWGKAHNSKSVGDDKRRKARAERHRARLDPEAPPGYGFYRGDSW